MAHAQPKLLTLLRHGVAVDREGWKGNDLERPLTEKGARRLRAAARGLCALGVAPDRVLTSPAIRALQTAKLAAEELGVAARRIEEEPALLPGASPDELLGVLGRASADELLCVGHAPHLDDVLALLLGLRHGHGSLALKKGGAAILELDAVEPGRGELRALLAPSMLRRIARR